MGAFPFVGREREIRRVAESLTAGRNVVLVGTPGIGRSSLIRHVAGTMGAEWQFHFVDFSKTPGEASRALARILPSPRAGRRAPASLGYSDRRFRIARWRPRGPARVIVMEDIVLLSAPMLGFIRALAGAPGRFRLVSVVERALPADSLRALRGCLWPSEILRLSALSRRASMEMIEYLSNSHLLGWSPDMIRIVAASTFGNPSLIYEFVRRALEERGCRGSGRG